MYHARIIKPSIAGGYTLFKTLFGASIPQLDGHFFPGSKGVLPIEITMVPEAIFS